MEKILTTLKFQLLLFVCTYVKGQDSICPTIANFSWMQANAPDRYQRFTYLENFTANYILSNGRLINPSVGIIFGKESKIEYNLLS